MDLLISILSVHLIIIGFLFITSNVFYQKIISLYGSFFLLILSSYLWLYFDNLESGYQYETVYFLSESLNLYYHIGVDGLSLFFVILTIMLLPICILCSWTVVQYRVREYLVLLYFITFLVVHVFVVLDLLLFYIFFESVLIPMFFVILIWGSRGRKVHAAYQFFLYTLVGSLIMLIGILYLYITLGSTHLYVLLGNTFSFYENRLLWLSFFLSFAVKVPMIPVHIWLPEAHVEAPTAGSVILAGILLKMGTYGLLRFSIPLFPEATIFYQPLVFLMSIIGILYASCSTIRQIDLKKIIAYSSVGHMNFVTIGLMSPNLQGVEGSIVLMISHGFVSSALFLCIGLLYDRYGTRLILYYGGLVYGMPIFSFLFLLFTLANVSLPGTSSFIGEILVLIGISSLNLSITGLAAVGIILGAVYAMWLYNRVIFGKLKIKYLKTFHDVNFREFLILLYLLLIICLVGVYPVILSDSLHLWAYDFLEHLS